MSVLVALGAIALVAVSFSVSGADPALGPVPPTTNTVTFAASPVTNLADGQTVTFSVTTSGTAKLVGDLTAHLCKHGFTSYSTQSFGYDTNTGNRCVYAPNIVSGGLTGAAYEKVYGPYAGTETTSGSLTFNVGTGTVTWGNNGGFGPFTLDTTQGADLVVQVNLVGDDTPTTYFIQPLTFTGSAVSTTTTTVPSTTSTSTTSTSTSTSTTTTAPTTTTTSVPATTSTTVPSSSTTTTTVKPTTTTTSTTVAPTTTTTVKPTTTTTTTVKPTTTTTSTTAAPTTTTTVKPATTTTSSTIASSTTIAPSTTSTSIGSLGGSSSTSSTTSGSVSGTGSGSTSSGSGSSASSGSSGSLPFTGDNAAQLAVAGALLVGLGLVALRRRTTR